MNFEQARFNMIEQQIRPWLVSDQHTLDLIDKIHREDFVPKQYKQLALADTRIPLLRDQVTMTPKVEARLLQSLAIKSHDNILEIGTGCGYLTALLANSGNSVHSIDVYHEFVDHAKPIFENYGLNNIELICGDAIDGWETSKSYDVIVLTGSVPILKDHFQKQLNAGGRLFVIVGQSPAMEARLITKNDSDSYSTEVLFETDLPALVGAPEPDRFRF